MNHISPAATGAVREVHGNDVEQVHITHVSCNTVIVSWSSGAPRHGTNGTLLSNPYNSTCAACQEGCLPSVAYSSCSPVKY
jgi:hypothetical protein